MTWLTFQGGGGPDYPPVQQGIPAAVKAGQLSLSAIENSVRRLLRARIRLGMFDDPATLAYNRYSMADVASDEHLALAETGAREGMTLLKNEAPAGSTNKALPLSLSALQSKTLAVIGPNANASYILLGPYSDPLCCTAGIPTILEEIEKRAGSMTVAYAPGCLSGSCSNSAGFAKAGESLATPSKHLHPSLFFFLSTLDFPQFYLLSNLFCFYGPKEYPVAGFFFFPSLSPSLC